MFSICLQDTVNIRLSYVHVNAKIISQNYCVKVVNSITEYIYMYFVKWIAYQDPNPHGMQQIGLSTK